MQLVSKVLRSNVNGVDYRFTLRGSEISASYFPRQLSSIGVKSFNSNKEALDYFNAIDELNAFCAYRDILEIK